MSDSEKPFACTTLGCNMSFVNEDHLTVHKKKHDMMLNLGINNKSNFFIDQNIEGMQTDQTPTPTRFIRNCEEVGLFQDLQADNPFEETFRRAVESGKSGVLTVPEVDDNDDTLHTPNIFPHIPECTNSIPSGNSTVKIDSTIEQTIENKEASDNNLIPNEIDINTVLKDNSTTPSLSNATSVDSVKNDSPLPINGAEMQLLLKTQDGKVLRFVAAPVIEPAVDSVIVQTNEPIVLRTSDPQNDKSKIDLKTIQEQKLSMAKIKLKQTLIKNGTAAITKPVQNNENENKPLESRKEESRSSVHPSKKQAILERNRASSMRSRAKRKAWIEQLQDSLKIANQTNATLQTQLKSLHGQVAKLKALLLAHKDCPVTKAMEQGNGVVIDSKVLTIKPNEMKQIPVIVGSKAVKRISTEKEILSKKKPLILSTIKNPMILPKSDSTANTITLHGATAIKTIPTINIVAPVITNAECGKTVLGFLHPDSRKIPLIPQDAFTINESFNENVASKATGT